MSETIFWFGQTKRSKYYIDPLVRNGECITTKPANPDLIEKNRNIIYSHNIKAQGWNFKKKVKTIYDSGPV
jgi:hypothetical protein